MVKFSVTVIDSEGKEIVNQVFDYFKDALKFYGDYIGFCDVNIPSEMHLIAFSYPDSLKDSDHDLPF